MDATYQRALQLNQLIDPSSARACFRHARRRGELAQVAPVLLTRNAGREGIEAELLGSAHGRELMALLGQDPSAEAWESIVSAFTRWPDSDTLSAAVGVALHALERWPDHLREAPRLWLRLVERGEAEPCWPLVRSATMSSGIDLRSMENAHRMLGQLVHVALTPSADGLSHCVFWKGASRLRSLDLKSVGRHKGSILVNIPDDSGLEHLDCGRMTASELDALLRCWAVPGLTSLEFSHQGYANEELEAFFRSLYAPKLRRLRLPHSGYDPGERIASLTWASLPRLTELDVQNVGPRTLAGLPETNYFGRLSALRIANSPSAGVSLPALVSDPRWPARLRRLSIVRCNTSTSFGAALGAWSGLSGLRHLELSDSFLGDEACMAIFSCQRGFGHYEPRPKQLRTLSLRECLVTHRTVRAIAQNRFLRRLESLDVSRTAVSTPGVEMIIGMVERSETLRHVDITGCRVSARVKARLRDALRAASVS